VDLPYQSPKFGNYQNSVSNSDLDAVGEDSAEEDGTLKPVKKAGGILRTV